MAPSPFNPKASRHARSISLPSRSHPLTLQVEGQLNRLRASETTLSSSICYNLVGLKNLYDSVNDLLLLPVTQQTLAQERGEKWVDEVLDGSLRSLDVCGTARDVLSQMKECVTELQYSLRRIRGESDLANEVEAFNVCRKKVIRKCLADLRKVVKQRAFSTLLDKNQDTVAMVSVLNEVEAITLSMVQSLLLSLVSGPKAMPRTNGWSLVSNFINKKRVACDGEEMERYGFEKVDAALTALLLGHKTHKGLELSRHVEAQKRLETLELSIRDLEDGLESVFRSLIKNRVTLLNILNQ